jgi:quercetin dioxygenase-like cupin family protein
VLASTSAPVAGATPAQGDIERTDLAQGTTDAPVTIISVGHPTTLYVQQLELGRHATSGWHTHPGPEHSVVSEGSLKVRTAHQCGPVEFAAGQSIFIPAGVPHVVYNDAAETAEAVVTYTLPAGLPVREDAPAACP